MKIVDQRYLASHNRYSNKPCLLSILELDDAQMPSSAEIGQLALHLRATLPGLKERCGAIGLVGGAAANDDDALALAQLVQAVTLELLRLACDEDLTGFVGAVPQMVRRFRLVQPYRLENVSSASLALALQLVQALLAGRELDLASGLAALRVNADRRAQRAEPGQRNTSPLRERRIASCRRQYDQTRRLAVDLQSIASLLPANASEPEAA
ncbi:hypothetical protein HSX11_12165 [Oxalobacteraceae bacterium]|nr:hypothetical protein [Oxalobacteraceae bacterium]